MRSVWSLVKWMFKCIGVLLLLIVIAGLFVRVFGPKPHEPLGELVDIGDFKLHIKTTGHKNNKPTVVIEGGSGTATEYYHWLSEGLKDSLRVIRYDRAGIGYSESSNTPRDPITIAKELHLLLEKVNESPPYIMVGHSLGGSYIRKFTELYPNEVNAMVLLDATHPNRANRIKSIPSASSWKFKTMIGLQKTQAILADMGIIMLYDMAFGPSFGREMDGLPSEINDRTIDFLIDGKYTRAMTNETAYYHVSLNQTRKKGNFGDLPIRIFPSAERKISEEDYQKYLRRGMDLRKNQTISRELQRDYLNLSSKTKLIELNGDHNSIFTKKENADVICQEILNLINEKSGIYN